MGAHGHDHDLVMRRVIAAPLLALLVMGGLVAGAQSDPGTGVSVPTLAEHNAAVADLAALTARVSELEDRATAADHQDSSQNNRLDALEEWVESGSQPTEEPTATPTEEPT